MPRCLLVTVRLHDGRYHGAGEGPPAPARLFQALVAGAGLGGPRCLEPFEAALRWLERLGPPFVATPALVNGQAVKRYVPNNDADAVGGDPRRIGKIRTDKPVRPRLISAGETWLYAWPFDREEQSEDPARMICTLAERLYQFGRGVDMAWACGEVIDKEVLEQRFAAHPGPIYRPSLGGEGIKLACPKPGSLESLQARYEAGCRRFSTRKMARSIRQVFAQPPKPRFRQVAYESPPARRVYELRERSPEARFGAWPLEKASTLVSTLRDRAVRRLEYALPDKVAVIRRVLVGRRPDGSNAAPLSARVRILPLPSIGHEHADHEIRRVLVEVPGECPVRADDVHWAFSGLDIGDMGTKVAADLVLATAADDRMLRHYGVGSPVGYRLWRTVTPAALPLPREVRVGGKRRRADSPNAERSAELKQAGAAVARALRHAKVSATAVAVRPQREPFAARGKHAAAFAAGTRFAGKRLWHLEITFAEPTTGPLVIGNGRFLGLGVMAPVREHSGVHAFAIDAGLHVDAEAADVTRALRRAVMSRAQEVLGPRKPLPTFFTGHDPGGAPARREARPHLAFVFDRDRRRLLVLAPHVLERRSSTAKEEQYLRYLKEAVAELRELRAGPAGCLSVRPVAIVPEEDPLFAPSTVWETMTRYQVTRHAKEASAAGALAADLHTECRRSGLPMSHVTTRNARGVKGVGLVGMARLEFQVAVAGPILLGRNRHLGGGAFANA